MQLSLYVNGADDGIEAQYRSVKANIDGRQGMLA
jgi:hypothetical protein